jgi:hypothetical protein
MMKNTFALFAAILLVFAVLGCSSINPFGGDSKPANSSTPASNKTLGDQAIDTAVGDQKIGIPECDEVVEMLAAEARNPDDNFVTKAVKQTFLNKMRDAIKQSLEENKNDKAEVAKTCKEIKQQLVKFKNDSNAQPK